MAAGASIDLMDQAWWSPGLIHPDGRATFALCFTGGIFVDRAGRRFVNESAAYDRSGAARSSTPCGPVPSGGRTGWSTTAVPVNSHRSMRRTCHSHRRASMCPQACGEGDTVAELAREIGVPADNLTETVRRFNAMAERGDDEDFGRGRESFDRAFTGGASPLVPIDTSPYRAAAFGVSISEPGRVAHRYRRTRAGCRRSADPRPVRGGKHHGRCVRYDLSRRRKPHRCLVVVQSPRGAAHGIQQLILVVVIAIRSVGVLAAGDDRGVSRFVGRDCGGDAGDDGEAEEDGCNGGDADDALPDRSGTLEDLQPEIVIRDNASLHCGCVDISRPNAG